MALPDPKNDEAFPPNDFVERETAVLRVQRLALLDADSGEGEH